MRRFFPKSLKTALAPGGQFGCFSSNISCLGCRPRSNWPNTLCLCEFSFGRRASLGLLPSVPHRLPCSCVLCRQFASPLNASASAPDALGSRVRPYALGDDAFDVQLPHSLGEQRLNAKSIRAGCAADGEACNRFPRVFQSLPPRGHCFAASEKSDAQNRFLVSQLIDLRKRLAP